MNRFFNFSTHAPHKIIAITILITIIMGFGVSQVTITENREEFLPEDHTSYKVLKDYESSAGKLITEAIMVEGENLTSADSFKKIERITSEIWMHEDLEGYISWIRSYPEFLIPTLEDEVEDWENLSDHELEQHIDNLLARPEFQKDTGIYISEDRTGAVITLIINNNLSKSMLNEKTEILHSIINGYDEEFQELTLSSTGTISTDQAIRNGIIKDLSILIPIAALFIIIVLYLTFRRFLDTILPFIVLAFGAIWMVGTMGLLGIPFYANFTIIVPLLLGVGIDYTIHLLNRYYQERGEGKNSIVSAANSVKTVGVAIFLTALTTVIGFASFGISDMPPIKSFGLVAGIGVFYVFLLSNTVLPSLLIIRDREKKIDAGEDSSWIQDKAGKVLAQMENAILNYSKVIVAAVIIISILAVFPIMNLSTTMSSDIMMPKGAEAIETQNALENYFRGYGTDSKAFILVEGDTSLPSTLELIAELQESIMSNPQNKNLIMGTTSLSDLIKKANGGNIPQDQEQLSKILDKFSSNSDPKFGKIMLSQYKTVINISYETNTMEEQTEATEIIREEVKKMAAKENVAIELLTKGEPSVSGMPVVFSDISNSIKPDLISSILLAVILVIITLVIVFKSLYLGLLGAVPITLTLIWEIGLLGSLGISLNVMNMLVSAIAIGIGVDFTIHVTHRFMEEWKEKGAVPEKAISRALQSTGRALLSAAITTIGVFIIISFSSSPMLVSFGWLSAIVIFLSLIGALFLLPIILLRYAKTQSGKKQTNKA